MDAVVEKAADRADELLKVSSKVGASAEAIKASTQAEEAFEKVKGEIKKKFPQFEDDSADEGEEDEDEDKEEDEDEEKEEDEDEDKEEDEDEDEDGKTQVSQKVQVEKKAEKVQAE